MSAFPEPTPMELASLIVSKTCHDIISPVGASSSAMEMWVTANDDSTREVAQTLMQKSAAQAVHKLSFVRLAYGAYGDVGGDVDLGEAKDATVPYITDDRTTLSWNLERVIAPKAVAKLAMGLLALTKDAVPRGGEITIDGTDLTGKAQFVVRGEAKKVIIPQGAEDALSRRFADGVHARNVHLFHLIRVADEVGVRIEPDMDETSITFKTVPI
ncbi:MAG: histidine phosphotransferase family protein [Hyphomicrobiales bacterium]|jgi:histidine phosphotransferase ChpT